MIKSSECFRSVVSKDYEIDLTASGKKKSFERHGFWSREAVVLTQRLAARKASMLGLEPSSEIQHWYAVIACAIQRTNAKILRGEPVPACAYPLPRAGFATGRRDLPLAGR